MSACTAAQFQLDEFGLEFPNGADPTFDALMATVLDSGGDSTAYLVLADWLEEHGRHSEALAHRLRAIDPTWGIFIDIEVDDVSIAEKVAPARGRARCNALIRWPTSQPHCLPHDTHRHLCDFPCPSCPSLQHFLDVPRIAGEFLPTFAGRCEVFLDLRE